MSAEEVLARHTWLATQSCCRCSWGDGDMSDDLNHVQHQLDALKTAGYAVVELPKPGPLSDHHHDGDRVWYFDQDGEFILTDGGDLWDTEGNGWSPSRLRDMALAALASADAAEVDP